MRSYVGLIIKSMKENQCEDVTEPRVEMFFSVFQHIVDLLKCVRLGLLTTNFFLEKVKCHPYIVDNEDCKPLVVNTLKYLYELDVDAYRVGYFS